MKWFSYQVLHKKPNRISHWYCGILPYNSWKFPSSSPHNCLKLTRDYFQKISNQTVLSYGSSGAVIITFLTAICLQVLPLLLKQSSVSKNSVTKKHSCTSDSLSDTVSNGNRFQLQEHNLKFTFFSEKFNALRY